MHNENVGVKYSGSLSVENAEIYYMLVYANWSVFVCFCFLSKRSATAIKQPITKHYQREIFAALKCQSQKNQTLGTSFGIIKFPTKRDNIVTNLSALKMFMNPL